MGRGGDKIEGLAPSREESTERFVALADGCLHVIGDIREAVKKANSLGRPLRVKLGLDPTAPDIHLGHTVALQKARDFQDAGATVVLIIGDYTSLVGDPTGRNSTRPSLSKEEIDKNAETYQTQAFKILLPEATEVRRNSEWLGNMSSIDMFDLLRSATLAQILERNDFKDRYEKETPISMLELVYPLLQGLDSVKIDADIELGGSDQLYNLTVGRGMNQQVCLTLPILVGTDGSERMSKSKGNYVGVSQDPDEMFGRLMSLPDEAMPDYFRLVSGHPDREKIIADIEEGAIHLGKAKRLLAHTIIARYHSDEAASAAEEAFDIKHVKREVPEDIPSFSVPPANPEGNVFLPNLLKEAFSLASGGEARRLLKDGAIKLDGEPLTSLEVSADSLKGRVLQAGKRRFVRLEG
jgi:tyrosyl-tRNA synthetase